MLYAIAILLGVMAGILAKGRISRLMELKFRRGWVILMALAIQVAAQAASVKGLSFVSDYSIIIQGITYCMLLVVFWFNRQYLGMLVIGAGCAMNFLVTIANGGRMPVDEAFVRSVVTDDRLLAELARDGKHILGLKDVHLGFLSDIMHPPGFLSAGMQVVSLGDLAAVAGLFLIVFEVITGKKLGLIKSVKQ